MRMLSLLLLLSGSFITSFSQSAGSLSPDEFEQGIKLPQVQVLDVRSVEEFKTGNIADALQADWNNRQEFIKSAGHLDKEKPVYVYCLAGVRSQQALDYLKENGFRRVFHLQGGINAWKKAGKPLENARKENGLTLNEYNKLISVKGPVLVDFGAVWCGPCKKMDPVVDQLKQKHPELVLIKLDADDQPALLKELNIYMIPAFFVYRDGKQTWKTEGMVSYQRLEKKLGLK